jgi:predicted aspartyl protease
VFFFFLSPFLRGESTVIPFRLVNNLIIIEANIEANTGNLILDTGSDGFFIDQHLSVETKNNAEFSTLNGVQNVSAFTVKSLTVGTISKKNLEAFYTNLAHLESLLSIDLAGIIGVELFNPHSLFIDFEKKQIHFFKKESRLAIEKNLHEADFILVNNIPVVKIKIDDKTYNFIFDSGASVHVVDESLVKKHGQFFNKTADPVNFLTLENSKAPEMYYYTLTQLELGSSFITNTKCLVKDFSSIESDFGMNIHGIISMSNLNQTGIVVDFQKMKIFY